MPSLPRYRIAIAKEDIKFSAAHFTIFPDGQAELLHGHNYQVQVELSGAGLDGEGLLVDLESFKRTLRERCARLDSHTLLPSESPHLHWSHENGSVEVRFADRIYRFPADDILLLPLVNTSMELLARLLWDEIAPSLAGSRVDTLAVSVQESAGQRCWYEAGISP